MSLLNVSKIWSAKHFCLGIDLIICRKQSLGVTLGNPFEFDGYEDDELPSAETGDLIHSKIGLVKDHIQNAKLGILSYRNRNGNS